MLDFYLIKDDEATWPDPPQHRFVGGLTGADHQALRSLWETLAREAIAIPYHEDCRLTASELVRMESFALPLGDTFGPSSSRHSFERFHRICAAAIATGAGLAAYCD